jgi:hypothetical protein
VQQRAFRIGGIAAAALPCLRGQDAHQQEHDSFGHVAGAAERHEPRPLLAGN